MAIKTKYPEVFINTNESNFYYKIIQVIDNKNVVRRRVSGRPIKKSAKGNPKCDMFRNQLFDRFKNIDDAIQHANNFVENFLILIK